MATAASKGSGAHGSPPPEKELWSVLKRVLGGGGVLVDDSTFVAPYVFASFPDELDAFRHGVVTGTGVRVRKAPGLHGEELTTLSHAVVPVPQWREAARADGYDWVGVEVELADGRRGYVAGTYIRSPLDYRAVLFVPHTRPSGPLIFPIPRMMVLWQPVSQFELDSPLPPDDVCACTDRR